MESKEEDKSKQQATLNILQPNFIWKNTKQDGLLPISNFAAAGEQKGGKVAKKSAVATNSSNMGKITNFKQPKDIQSTTQEIPFMSKNTYILLAGRGCYGLVQERKSPSLYVVKIPVAGKEDLEDAEVDLLTEKEGFSLEVRLTIRVIASEEKKFTI